MMDINLVRNNLKEIASGNIVRLISDVLLHNIDKIENYKTNQMYYEDDVVYIYDATTDKHKLYRCKVNRSTVGAFNATQWEEYIFKFNDRAVTLESKFTATVDATSTCAINQPLFNYLKDTLNVYHSVRGRLAKGTDWNLSTDKQSIVLSGFTLYKNESLLFEVIK
jgi:hypothetical protein